MIYWIIKPAKGLGFSNLLKEFIRLRLLKFIKGIYLTDYLSVDLGISYLSLLVYVCMYVCMYVKIKNYTKCLFDMT